MGAVQENNQALVDSTVTKQSNLFEDPSKQAEYDKDGKLKRTAGLKVTDALFYWGVNNIGVFAISVGFTFMSKYGDKMAEMKIFPQGTKWFPEMMFKRTGKVEDFLVNKFNMTKNKQGTGSAEMTRMVALSFLDGCIMAFPIAWLENNRTHVARTIDDMLGTRPATDDVYEQEPKQDLGTILAGRILTAGIVIPTAVAMDCIVAGIAGDENKNTIKSLNNHLFDGPGAAVTSGIKQVFPKLDLKPSGTLPKPLDYLGFTMAFEAFYTSVCTGGLYIMSRAVATVKDNFFKDKDNENNQPQQDALPQQSPTSALAMSDMPVLEGRVAENEKAMAL
ncbi:MAG: hypothetical protein EAY65_05025 [Alphaproteobacteria bacterium]|nr:MAG: hypothetical protein EAY65_05025 [Alphaproteobacteria bacterium]